MVDSDTRVLMILPTPMFFSQCGGIGGHVSHVRGIHDALKRAGIRCDLITSEMPPFEVSGEVYVVRPAFRPLWQNRIVQIAAHCMMNKKYVCLYVRHAFMFSLWVLMLKWKIRQYAPGMPLVLELNSLGRPDSRICRYWQSIALKAADLVLCVSRHLQVDAIRICAKRQQHVFYCPNGVDLSRFVGETKADQTMIPSPTQNLVKGDEPFRIGYCGSIKSGYGLEMLFEAFCLLKKKIPQSRLIVIGDGPDRVRLQQNHGHVEDVEWRGAVSFENVPCILMALDALVFTAPAVDDCMYGAPSYGEAGDSIKLWEYMASGTPVVVAAVNCTRPVLGAEDPAPANLNSNGDLFEVAPRGLLYDPQKPMSLAGALCSIVFNRDEAQARAQRAREYAVTVGSWDQRVACFLERVARVDGRGERL